MGPPEQRYAHMRHAAVSGRQNFQADFEILCQKMKILNDDFVSKTVHGKMSEEQSADFIRRNSSKFEQLLAQFGELRSQGERTNGATREVLSRAEYRMNQWPLTKWAKDNGICTIL
jgi:hypothetical protein